MSVDMQGSARRLVHRDGILQKKRGNVYIFGCEHFFLVVGGEEEEEE
jgi:hypothetical protein